MTREFLENFYQSSQKYTFCHKNIYTPIQTILENKEEIVPVTDNNR